jgi:carboxyl-terminal processing protease
VSAILFGPIASRPVRGLLLALSLLLLACTGVEREEAATRTRTPARSATTAPAPTEPPTPDDATVPSLTPAQYPAQVVAEVVRTVQGRFFEEIDAGRLFAEAWEGAATALTKAGVTDVPAVPAYPRSYAQAVPVHLQQFARLEELAKQRLSLVDLTTAAVREVINRRRDCHTSYVPADVLRSAGGRTTRGESLTLGVGFSTGTPPRIASILPGTPAQAAGLRHGQIVVTINGRPTETLTGVEAQALLDTHEGVANMLTVRDTGGTYDVTISAARVRLPVEEHQVLPGNIGLIRFYNFPSTNQLAEQLRKALEQFEAAGVRGWIIDLRDNSGGAVTTAVAVASLFTERGRLYKVITRGALDTFIQVDGSALPFQRPLVFLVGPGSNSAAEIVPGALQGLGRATLVGERTGGCIGYGRVAALPDGSLLSITEAEVLIGPEERRLNGIGVNPDIAIARTPEDELAGRDPQLEAAIRVIEGR